MDRGQPGVEQFRRGAASVQHAWPKQRREGRPRLLALPYFSLGPRAQETATAFLSDDYAVEGQPGSDFAVNAVTDADAVRNAIAAYEDAGCDELILFPCSPDPQQVRMLAAVIRHGPGAP